MRFVTADKVFDGKGFLPLGSVLVVDTNGFLFDIVLQETLQNKTIEHFNGFLTPGFVNAHCHLELSHLKGYIAGPKGLSAFAKEVVSRRNNFSREVIQEAITQADNEMYKKGIVAVGDVSNTMDTLSVKKQSGITYHTFVELIGLNPQHCESIFTAGLRLQDNFKREGLRAGLAAHAPYSCSNKLIELIAQHCIQGRVPFSIHNQESDEETKFFFGNKSGIHDLYDFLKLDISWFKAPQKSSLQNYAALIPDDFSLLIHNTFTSQPDIDLVRQKNIQWCFCPQANLYIEGRLPEYTLFKTHKSRLCIGTDSLAGNTQLDLIAEANCILKKTSLFSLEDLLGMITLNGARALRMDDRFGSFIVGKNAGINLVEFKNAQLHFIKKIC